MVPISNNYTNHGPVKMLPFLQLWYPTFSIEFKQQPSLVRWYNARFWVRHPSCCKYHVSLPLCASETFYRLHSPHDDFICHCKTQYAPIEFSIRKQVFLPFHPDHAMFCCNITCRWSGIFNMEITATCLWFLGCTTDYCRSTLVMYICFESLSSFFIRCRALVVFFFNLGRCSSM